MTSELTIKKRCVAPHPYSPKPETLTPHSLRVPGSNALPKLRRQAPSHSTVPAADVLSYSSLKGLYRVFFGGTIIWVLKGGNLD